MKHVLIGLFGMALISNLSLAGDGAPAPTAQELSQAVEKVNYVQADASNIRISGYVDVGYLYNFTGKNAVTNRVPTDGHPGGDFNLNAVKLTIDKALTNRNEWQAGFRTDLLIGEDAQNATGNQDGASTLFLQQGYVVFRAPYGNGIDVKAGKFTSWLGYEGTDRPGNMNITYSQLYTIMPQTMTGVSFEYPVDNNLDVGFAIGNGKTSDDNWGSFDSADGYGIMAKVNYQVRGGNANWQNSVYYTWDSAYQVASYGYPADNAHNNNNAVIYDSVLNWAPKFANGKLLFGVNADLAYAEGTDLGTTKGSSTLWGMAGYSKYQFSPLFSLAGRIAYLHVDDPGAFNAMAMNNVINPFSEDSWSFTLTAGFNVVENMIIRTEYRCDVGNGSTTNQQAASGDVAHTAAMEIIYTF